jgi:hypothetical protein
MFVAYHLPYQFPLVCYKYEKEKIKKEASEKNRKKEWVITKGKMES